MKPKKKIRNMKNCGVKAEIWLGQSLKAQMIVMKNIWKANLIQMKSYLKIK